MARPSAIVTEARRSVLKRSWQHGPSVVREISDAIYSDYTPPYHATVNSLLDQLEARGRDARSKQFFRCRNTALAAALPSCASESTS